MSSAKKQQLNFDSGLFVTADSGLKDWADFAADYLKLTDGGPSRIRALTHFLVEYLPDTRSPYDPKSFMSPNDAQPDYYEHRGLDNPNARGANNYVHKFINFVRRKVVIADGPTDADTITPKYRNPVSMRSIKTGELIVSDDRDEHFYQVTDVDPSLERWRLLAATWWPKNATKHARLALDAFCLQYIHALDLSRDPVEFLQDGANQPDFWSVVSPHDSFKQAFVQRSNAINSFLNWLMTDKFGVADRYGIMKPRSDFHNPVPRRNYSDGTLSHSSPGNHSEFTAQEHREFTHLLAMDPELEEWRSYAMRWLARVGNNHHRRTALNTFFKDYVVGHSLARDPVEFFDAGHEPPSFWKLIRGESVSAYIKNNLVHTFLEWVLKDVQRSIQEPLELRNPVERQLRSRADGGQRQNTTKQDSEFTHLLALDFRLEPWRALVADYHRQLTGETAKSVRGALNHFIRTYVIACELPKDPVEFFRTADSFPTFWEVYDEPTPYARNLNNRIHYFLETVLEKIEDELGESDILLTNPVPYRNMARQRGNQERTPERAADLKLDHIVEFDSSLQPWKEAVSEWLESPDMQSTKTLSPLRAAINTFLMDYISGLNLERNPREFLTRNLSRISFGEFINPTTEHGIKVNNFIHRLCDWLITDRYATTDTNSIKVAAKDLYNPLPLRGRNGGKPRLRRQSDYQFFWVEYIDRSLEDWRVLAAEWFAEYAGNRTAAVTSMGKFLELYIHDSNITRDPLRFVRRSYHPTETFEQCLIRDGASNDTIQRTMKVLANFIDWVLDKHVTAQDDYGAKISPTEFHNPIQPPEYRRSRPSESYRETLPFEWLQELQSLLVPGANFRDLEWAREKALSNQAADWFKVDEGLIDKDDPDCVLEARRVHEDGKLVTRTYMWSPVRTIALLLKLILPLRTFQVRFLESGENDTWRYMAKGWQLNQGLHATGTERTPTERGVFRRLVDLENNTVTAGFYINTNKTADTFAEKAERGYVIPWQHEDALYWLEKLRNWQEKYNPVTEAVPWTSLESKHLSQVKPRREKLLTRGRSYFLFRDAAARRPSDRVKPIPSAQVELLWDRFLAHYENVKFERGETLPNGEKILLVDPSTGYALFPLHNLRVSLITAYALRGKVPFPVLSKLVAGHASVIMTLYYTKVGNALLTETMRDAEALMATTSLAEIKQFVHNASERQLLDEMVFTDKAALEATTSMRSPAAFRVMDYGICPRNGNGCHEGGEMLVENSNQTLFGPVPGYPATKNCARCRFFVTGPAFLPALTAHANALLYEIKQVSKKLTTLNERKLELEDRKASSLDSNELFVMSREEESLMHSYDVYVSSTDGLLNDLVATVELIDSCTQLTNPANGSDIQLVMPGGYEPVRWAFETFEAETSNEHLLAEARQLQLMCENAEKYSFVDGTRPALQRARLIDTMLQMNNFPQMMMTLPEEELLKAGNQLLAIIRAKAGSADSALEVLTGQRKLADIGILDDSALRNRLQRIEVTGLTSDEQSDQLILPIRKGD